MARMHAHNIWNAGTALYGFSLYRSTIRLFIISYFKVRQDFTLHCSEFVLYSLQQQKRLTAGPRLALVKLYASITFDSGNIQESRA